MSLVVPCVLEFFLHFLNDAPDVYVCEHNLCSQKNTVFDSCVLLLFVNFFYMYNKMMKRPLRPPIAPRLPHAPRASEVYS